MSGKHGDFEKARLLPQRRLRQVNQYMGFDVARRCGPRIESSLQPRVRLTRESFE